MGNKNFDIVNFEGFVDQFMGNPTKSFEFKQSPIQIYPLNIAFSFIKVPIPLFRTDYNFLLLFLDGGGEQQVDNDLIKLQANDVLFIREGHLNAIKSILPSTDGYYIYIDSLLLSQIFPDKALLNRFTFNPKHAISKLEMDWLCQCCQLLINHKNNFSASEQTEISLIRAIVIKLAETWPTSLSKSNRQSEISMRFKELLYENYMRNRDVKFYADLLAISENYLNRCVKQVTNKAPKQHINEVVIYNSKVLLQDLSKDITQIAFQLNFSDASYFGRLFKQITNLTPSQYRILLKQDLSDHVQESS
ncbi:AraC family transcriptional regulator [Pedobacter psychrodurus]|uniref:AraC family transcriptional regulator n=1 Tax=Pedobacter psychrodurus TaxID=2530456 RepID=A0A4R0Q0E9_9SPHI|nr:AraC family transcriptional regulator [Pedobacter psychrodurus]TCD28336.1 AraC family transcriptional regulator [Pedobacter psychrodurus]